ncbi:vWA domain-containing protein [Hoeflea poritis]|uniref:RNA-binding protein n=1 Tax=Hoeflea poritis TaxID=2993659 RepID=A0ABT4VNZ9_9HYPH|nr:RNA-binding protein [Hoeflea poritis]MDA4846406.1 RNA-binding protein [Hoeflea poritis]
MANKSVFASMRGRMLPKTDAVNKEGAPAYAYEDRQKLAQLAMTGTIGDLFYQDAEVELDAVLDVANKVEPEYLAKAAIHARQRGHMKDMPALLLAVLASRDPQILSVAFPRVVTNGKMLRNFVQIMRSGQTGRKSLGSRPKALVAGWLNSASDRQLLQASIGSNPSLADVIKMVHPKPGDARREALFAWMIGKPCDLDKLPEAVQDYVAYQDRGDGPLPDVPFQMLTHLPLTAEHWAQIARSGSWQMVRMNLNTFLRRGAFGVKGVTEEVAATLGDRERIRKARVFPYQLMTTYQSLSGDMPVEIRNALHDAMEVAVTNVPKISGQVVVCPDVSGSMTSPVTGYRPGATTATRFVDVAALVSAAFLRRNRGTLVLPFEFGVRDVTLEARDTILTNARRLADLAGGGTNCLAPLEWLIARNQAPDLIVFVSDNQSWADTDRRSAGTPMMRNWEKLTVRNPKAKLVCIDIAPYGTTQVKSRENVLNIGGFSDAVFDQIAAFAEDRLGPDQWVGEIEGIEL